MKRQGLLADPKLHRIIRLHNIHRRYDEVRILQTRLDFLACAARAVVERWDSIDWKNTEHTGVVINRLRAALTAATEDKTT